MTDAGMASGGTSIVDLLNLPIRRFMDIYKAMGDIIQERNKRQHGG